MDKERKQEIKSGDTIIILEGTHPDLRRGDLLEVVGLVYPDGKPLVHARFPGKGNYLFDMEVRGQVFDLLVTPTRGHKTEISIDVNSLGIPVEELISDGYRLKVTVEWELADTGAICD